jgi:hypothetical protein
VFEKMPSEWVTKNQFDQAYLPVIQEKLYFEGEGATRATTNYIVLLTLATIIATYGLIAGSTATVIGAMIVAPLMTSIMAVTLGNHPRGRPPRRPVGAPRRSEHHLRDRARHRALVLHLAGRHRVRVELRDPRPG